MKKLIRRERKDETRLFSRRGRTRRRAAARLVKIPITDRAGSVTTSKSESRKRIRRWVK